MPVQFPVTCKLMDNEKEILTEILDDDESPCEGCAWASSCDGPEVQYKIENMLFDNPEKHCLVCGNATGPETNSKLISGSFRYCATNRDEYVFTPTLAAVATGNPDDIDF